MNRYKSIFFDLDKTLYDFERSSDETLRELFAEKALSEMVSYEVFHEHYIKNNLMWWDLYRREGIRKEQLRVQRFSLTFESLGIKIPGLDYFFSEEYLYRSPRKKALFKGVMPLLDYLFSKYSLLIITNGFEEVQHQKLKSNGIGQFFKAVITSEKAGCKKPEPEIFRYALEAANVDASEALMVGDDFEVDILGARNIGMDQALISHDNTNARSQATFMVKDLAELHQLFTKFLG